MRSLKINLYAITDNVKEIMEYHKIHSNFMDYFKDIIVSAEVGILKPDPKIYQHLLNKHNIDPFDSVFVDDLMANVESALSVKMHAFQFTDAKSCEEQLIKLGIKLK
nr:HAD-IA family hydrolase [Candidatus Trichorickettsia mobilis]